MKRSTFSDAFALLRFNGASVLLFECVYKLLAWAAFGPAMVTLFRWSLRLSGRNFITAKNLGSYLVFPTTPLLLFLVVLLGLAYVALELTALAHAFDASRCGVRVTAREIALKGLETIGRKNGRHGLRSAAVFLAACPVLGVLFSPSFYPEFRIPAFIRKYVARSNALSLCLAAAAAALVLLAVLWMFAVHFYALCGQKPLCAIRSSRRAMRGRFGKMLLLLALRDLVLTLPVLALSAAEVAAANAAKTAGTLPGGLLTIASALCLAVLAAVGLMLAPLRFCVVSAAFYRCRPEAAPPLQPYSAPELQLSRRTKAVGLAVIFVICSLTVGTFVHSLQKADAYGGLISVPVRITAHRGDVRNARENTLPAFESAIQNDFDCIELDVRPTSDGVPVVFHDSSLKRMCGRNLTLSSLTFSELETIPLLYTDGETIPTLQQALLLCRTRIPLNIELKNSDAAFIQNVLELLNKNGVLDTCVVASQDYVALRRVKAINPDITTVYITSFAYGDISSMKYVDAFSVESSSVTQTLTDSVHRAGKQIYAWTVNDESEMRRILELGVDDLITDNGGAAMRLRSSLLADTVVDTVADTVGGSDASAADFDAAEKSFAAKCGALARGALAAAGSAENLPAAAQSGSASG